MNKSEKPSYLKIFFRSLRLIFKSAPTKVTFLMIILALQIFIPVVQATAIAKFIDSVKTLSDVKSAILIMLPFIIAVLIDFLVGPLCKGNAQIHLLKRSIWTFLIKSQKWIT